MPNRPDAMIATNVFPEAAMRIGTPLSPSATRVMLLGSGELARR